MVNALQQPGVVATVTRVGRRSCGRTDNCKYEDDQQTSSNQFHRRMHRQYLQGKKYQRLSSSYYCAVYPRGQMLTLQSHFAGFAFFILVRVTKT